MKSITEYLPKGYVKDGSEDYTAYLQKAINDNLELEFPEFPISVNDRGLFLRSNQTINFLKGSEIRLLASSKEVYNIIRISELNNVTLINPVIIGDSKTHMGLSGEGGVGIGIRGSKNITLVKPNVRECWGDGIYIGQAKNIINPQNIVIKAAYLKRNRRSGLTVVSVDGLLVSGIYAGYSTGVAPFCGINFEPNNPECVMRGIRINSATTARNLGQGIQIGLRELAGKGDIYVDFQFNGHTDTLSKLGFKQVASPKDGTESGEIIGEVIINNAKWEGSKSGFPLYFSTNQPRLSLAMNKITVIDADGNECPKSELPRLIKRCVQGIGTYTLNI